MAKEDKIESNNSNGRIRILGSKSNLDEADVVEIVNPYDEPLFIDEIEENAMNIRNRFTPVEKSI